MTWFKVDDKLWGSPVWVQLPAGARGLWVAAGSWCGDHLTDGLVPTHMLPMLGGGPADAKALAETGGDASLWVADDRGWRFRDWLQEQPSAEQVLAEREASRERQRRARERSRKSRRDPAVGHAVTDAVSHAIVTPPVTVPPTRPDPTRPDHEQAPPSGVARRTPRATRISADWKSSEALIDQMRRECPGVDLERETEKFRDHWLGKAGPDAAKVDWDATYRNWIRRAEGDWRSAPRAGGGQTRGTTTDLVAETLARAAQLRAHESGRINGHRVEIRA